MATRTEAIIGGRILCRMVGSCVQEGFIQAFGDWPTCGCCQSRAKCRRPESPRMLGKFRGLPGQEDGGLTKFPAPSSPSADNLSWRTSFLRPQASFKNPKSCDASIPRGSSIHAGSGAASSGTSTGAAESVRRESASRFAAVKPGAMPPPKQKARTTISQATCATPIKSSGIRLSFC